MDSVRSIMCLLMSSLQAGNSRSSFARTTGTCRSNYCRRSSVILFSQKTPSKYSNTAACWSACIEPSNIYLPIGPASNRYSADLPCSWHAKSLFKVDTGKLFGDTNGVIKATNVCHEFTTQPQHLQLLFVACPWQVWRLRCQVTRACSACIHGCGELSAAHIS